MQIDQCELKIPGTDQPTTIGLNISNKYGRTVANIFVLAENKGLNVTQNIWDVAKALTEKEFPGKKPEDIEWTVSASYESSEVKFSCVDGQLYKIDWSNFSGYDHEDCMKSLNPEHFSIVEYQKYYIGEKAKYYSGKLERLPPPKPKTVFAIPCNNPAAKTGFFYCQPGDYQLGAKDCYVILADTQKLIAKIRDDDPEMLNHADYKFEESKAEDWLEDNSQRDAPGTGKYVYNEIVGYKKDQRQKSARADFSTATASKSGLTLNAGKASMLRLIQDLNLPFVPVAIYKAGCDLSELTKLIGYQPKSESRPLDVSQAFRLD